MDGLILSDSWTMRESQVRSTPPLAAPLTCCDWGKEDDDESNNNDQSQDQQMIVAVTNHVESR
jgi:hypothetical protein